MTFEGLGQVLRELGEIVGIRVESYSHPEYRKRAISTEEIIERPFLTRPRMGLNK